MNYGKVLSNIYRDLVLEKYAELADRVFNAFLDSAIVLDERVRVIPSYMAYSLGSFDDPIRVVTVALKHYEVPENVANEIVEELKKYIGGSQP